MTASEIKETLTSRDWTAEINMFGLWIIGPRNEDGIINVVGMGRTFDEALEMALRSKGNHD